MEIGGVAGDRAVANLIAEPVNPGHAVAVGCLARRERLAGGVVLGIGKKRFEPAEDAPVGLPRTLGFALIGEVFEEILDGVIRNLVSW